MDSINNEFRQVSLYFLFLLKSIQFLRDIEEFYHN